MLDRIYDLSELIHLNDGDAVTVPASDFMTVDEPELFKMISTDTDLEHRLDDLVLTDDWPSSDSFAAQETVSSQDLSDTETLTTKRFGRYGEIYGGYLD